MLSNILRAEQGEANGWSLIEMRNSCFGSAIAKMALLVVDYENGRRKCIILGRAVSLVAASAGADDCLI